MSLYPFEGVLPKVAPGVFIAPTAAVIGDVEIGEGASIWYHCVLRGDTNRIVVGARSNVQDVARSFMWRGARCRR